MSIHTIQRKLELATAAYLAAEIASPPSVRTTEDSDAVLERQACIVTAPKADGNTDLPACYTCTLTVELRTVIDLYSVRATAVASHITAWGLIADAMMQDDLADGIVGAGSDLGINGIENGHSVEYLNTSGVLVNRITRTIFAVAKTLT